MSRLEGAAADTYALRRLRELTATEGKLRHELLRANSSLRRKADEAADLATQLRQKTLRPAPAPGGLTIAIPPAVSPSAEPSPAGAGGASVPRRALPRAPTIPVAPSPPVPSPATPSSAPSPSAPSSAPPAPSPEESSHEISLAGRDPRLALTRRLSRSFRHASSSPSPFSSPSSSPKVPRPSGGRGVEPREGEGVAVGETEGVAGAERVEGADGMEEEDGEGEGEESVTLTGCGSSAEVYSRV